MSIRGTVSKTFEKEWNGRDGNVILHSFQLQGDNRYFRTGTDRIVSQGDYITFDIEGNNSVIPSSLEKKEAAPAQSAPKQQWGGGGFRGKPAAGKSENFEARQKYWENKEQRDIDVVEPRITFSAAQRDAIEVVGLALQHDMLAFGNASKGAKLGMLLDFVDEVTARFYAQRINAAETVSGMAPETATNNNNSKGNPEIDDE